MTKPDELRAGAEYPDDVWYTPEDNSSKRYVRGDLYDEALSTIERLKTHLTEMTDLADLLASDVPVSAYTRETIRNARKAIEGGGE